MRPIGIFDSGVGGLSVLRSLRLQLPDEAIIYLADQAHVPYGPRPLEQVRTFSEQITRYLLEQGARSLWRATQLPRQPCSTCARLSP